MNRNDAQELLELIHRLVDGADSPKTVAADIEGLLIERFQDESWFDGASEALALFVPGGSSPYICAGQLARELAPAAESLASTLELSATDA